MASDAETSSIVETASVFQSDLPIAAKLDRARMELLDLSARNRLLNMPRTSKATRSIEIVDEKSAEIFRLLVRENKAFTFVAGKAAVASAPADDAETQPDPDPDEITDLAQPEDDVADDRGVFSRHADTRLQTRLTPKGLQKRLLELFYDARTLEEEQGVNILYLALGTLKWIDPTNAANIRFAPLLLVPVALERGNAGEKFKLRARSDDFASNLSLEALLDRAHGIRLPAFEATDAFEPLGYMADIADATAAKPGWTVQPDDVALGFFSFAKFLMYRDLDPAAWPPHARIGERPLIRGLLSDGFEGADGMIPEDARIDLFISPADMLHIVDSDSSQALAVHEVRRGRDMVIQGPPGTGKSQTIANIVASAVADGKTVLFVAEKMAALEVVKRRLDAAGVGDGCLELHSNKANKRALLDELKRTWELGAPRGADPGTLHARLTEARDRLNGHAERLDAAHPTGGLTPFQVMAQLVRLGTDGERPNDLALDGATDWTPDEFAERRSVLSELVERVEAIGTPVDHVWHGAGLASATPMEVARLTARAVAIGDVLADADARQQRLAERLEREPAATPDAVTPLLELARRLAGAPFLATAALRSAAWTDERDAIGDLLATGERLTQLRTDLALAFTEAAWAEDAAAEREALGRLPVGFPAGGFRRLERLVASLPRLIEAAQQLARSVGRNPPASLDAIRRMHAVGTRVAAVPPADARSLAAEAWDSGVERAADLVGTLAELAEARTAVSGKFAEAAWDMDLGAARTTLATHGTGMLRLLSGEWRRADRLVRSLLADPAQPLADTLAQLDALARGQARVRRIEGEDAFGRAAFGTEWRGDRSAVATLGAIVDWIRSLKELGAEPRLIAADKPDHEAVVTSLGRLERELAGAADDVAALWDELPPGDHAFGSASSADRADLAALLQTAVVLSDADRTTAAMAVDVPSGLPERLRRLDLLAEGRRRASDLSAADALGREAFGEAWSGASSTWPALRDAAEWIAANEDVRALAARVDDRVGLPAAAEDVEAARDGLLAELARLLDELRFDVGAGLGAGSVGAVPFDRMAARLSGWAAGGEQLSKWVAYRDRAERARSLGCPDVVRRLGDGRLAPAAVIPAFEMAYYEALHADQVCADPELGRFDGTLHGRLARDFAELDLQRIAAASFEVVRAHHRRMPPRDGGAVGPLGALRAEMEKRRGHMPIRRLMERPGPAVQALKPVFMMSPLSVAQFLPAGVFEFDLLVMDEASQIQPVDALGAVARAKQVVVVGDPKQLPPTAFFAKMTGTADDDEDDGGRVADIESILGLFAARGLPTRMLRWHYRSKHQSLIAVSNRQFYENKLFIVPSPYTAEAGMGLRFHHVRDGVFDAGGTRTNQVEAKIVAAAIVAHARQHPDLSLGVAAFSAAQRRAVLDQLEVVRRTLPPETESFFQAHPAEPFFVKNLENVQGDERDVIFISVGYGPTTPGGRVPMRFGPLGSEGGERRLNVLISRAKQRCEVFSSMTDEDIDPDFARMRKGVFAFRLFLHFARTGRLTMGESTGRGHDSVFEEQVAKALQARGYQVHPQVGLAGFFIDLAVADAERPGRYLLGIECDGAAYHGARSARERDRLRQSVLESHGWNIHRVWSTDWFQRPAEQLELIVARIEAAKEEHDAHAAGRAARAVPLEIVAVERENVTEIGFVDAPGEREPDRRYVQAVLARPPGSCYELHDTPVGLLAGMVEEAVRVEGPVHVEEVVDRVRDAWGLKRSGGRIQQAVEAAVGICVRAGRITHDGSFLSIPGATVSIRERSATASSSLRRADMLPPAEIAAAAMEIVRRNLGATRDQTVQAASRALGIRTTGGSVRTAITTVLNELVREGQLTMQEGILSAATSPSRPNLS